MGELLVKLRKAAKFSQVELAQVLNISRQTLISIEKGERELYLSELRKISEVFEMPLSIILDDELSIEAKSELIHFDQKSFGKFHNLILQCIQCGAAKDGKITKTKLAKLVYLCDFAHYYKFLAPISGFDYKRLPQGPVAIEFFDIIDNDESLMREDKGNAIMISLVEAPDESVLSQTEKQIVKDVCHKWKDANTEEIVQFTHKQLPWALCKERERIPYELINLEDPANVY